MQTRQPAGCALTADQTESLDLLVDHPTARGVMGPKLLYESPFTDCDSQRVDGVSARADVLQLLQALRDLEPRSAA